MPTESLSSSISALAPVAHAVAKMTVKQLKQATEEQLDKLGVQGKKIITVESNLDLLMKRYQIGRSLISKAADWYGSKPWWIQLGMGILFVAISTLIAGVFGMLTVTLAVSITALSLYIAIAFILSNHYNATVEIDKRLRQDITVMESSLKESVDELNILGQKLNQVLIALNAENARLADHALTLEEQIAVLSKQVARFTDIIKQLEGTKQALELANEKLGNNFKQASKELLAAHATLATKTEELAIMSEKLAQVNTGIVTSTDQMADLDVQFQQNFRDLCALKEKMQTQLDILTAKAAEDKNHQEEVMMEPRTPSPTVRTPSPIERVELSKLGVTEHRFEAHKSEHEDWSEDLSIEPLEQPVDVITRPQMPINAEEFHPQIQTDNLATAVTADKHESNKTCISSIKSERITPSRGINIVLNQQASLAYIKQPSSTFEHEIGHADKLLTHTATTIKDLQALRKQMDEEDKLLEAEIAQQLSQQDSGVQIKWARP